MKKLILLNFVALIMLSACQKNETPETLVNAVDSISYYTGTFTAWTVKEFDVKDLNAEAFKAGMEKAFSKETTEIKLTDADFNIGWHFEKLQRQQNKRNEIQGKKFIKENKEKPGVITTNSGLQYKILEVGSGPTALSNDRVVINYTGTLIDGTIFTQIYSDTVSSGNDMIKGMAEAIELMNKKSKIKIFLAPELAFGNGTIPFLKPNMTVIYDIELIDIIKK
jgi:FKBP-type peptidyl-prolyl cis-trans isomerase